MRHYCTYFDSNYLLRGLSMYRSLQAAGGPSVLHALCLDEDAFTALRALALPGLHPIALNAVESFLPALTAAKANRSRVEYYFTLSPVLPLYLFATHPELDAVTYLDADLLFYSSPETVLAELGDRSVLVCEHRYPARHVDKLRYGRFNVQFQTFRRDETGLACLTLWRDQCLEWCCDHAEGDRYADQKYLDEWPALYGERLAIAQHPGAGLAPWNWETLPLSLDAGNLKVAGQPLVFYHYHGVKIFGHHLISNGLLDWGLMPWRIRRWLYAGYVRHLRATRRWLLEKTGIERPMRDRFIRGTGIGLASTREILRKAWHQAMLVL